MTAKHVKMQAITTTVVSNVLEQHCVFANFTMTLNDFADKDTSYDEYKIVKAKVTFIPTWSKPSLIQIGPNTTTYCLNGMPYLAAKVDHDDDVLASKLGELIQRGGKHTLWDKPTTFTFYPKPVTMQYRTAATTAYSVPYKSLWMDMQNADTPHYGLKTGVMFPVRNAGNAVNVTWYQRVECWVQYRNKISAGTNCNM